jgi:hypothetical protein
LEDKKDKIPFHKARLNLLDKEALRNISEEKRKQLRRDMAFCFGTPEGRRVLKHIMDLTGFCREKIGGNPQIGMDIYAGLLYNCSREQVFLELSKFIPANILRDAEFGIFEDLGL